MHAIWDMQELYARNYNCLMKLKKKTMASKKNIGPRIELLNKIKIKTRASRNNTGKRK